MIHSHPPKATYLPLLYTGIVAAIFSTVALAAAPVAEWFRGSFPASETTEVLAEDPADAGRARSKTKCAECGVIESMRRLAPVGNSPAVYEIIVRMRDGSARVNSQASPATWRTGERILLLGGENLPVK